MIKNRKMLLAAAIILLLAAAAGVIVFDRDSSIDFKNNLELAGKYLESSDYDNAIAIYNGLLAEDDSCSEAYAGLAEAYYTKGNTEKTLQILEKGLEYSADEDIVIEKIRTFFPDYDFAGFGYEDDEYYAEVPDGTELETETEFAGISEETSVTETTSVPDTEETTSTTTAEITTTAAKVVTTTAATTTVPITTTAAPVTTTTAPRTTATAATTTTAAAAKEPEAIIVEDLTVMTVSEAEAWCHSNNLSIFIIGDGEIISQSPAPGSIIEEYSEIIVRCE